jgi:hypothetical protein
MVRVTKLTQEYLPAFLDMIEKHEGIAKKNAIEQSYNALKPEEEYLVCIDVETNAPIGYSKMTALTHGILKLDYIYVIPALRRDTNGSIILVAVYNRAINQMMAGIIAECEESNEVGTQFLKARGFVLSKTEEGIHFFTKSLMHMYIPHKHED